MKWMMDGNGSERPAATPPSSPAGPRLSGSSSWAVSRLLGSSANGTSGFLTTFRRKVPPHPSAAAAQAWDEPSSSPRAPRPSSGSLPSATPGGDHREAPARRALLGDVGAVGAPQSFSLEVPVMAAPPPSPAAAVLHAAAAVGDLAALQAALARPGARRFIDEPNAPGNTALALSAYNGHELCVRALAAAGAEAAKPNRFGNTPLLLAVEADQLHSMIALLEIWAQRYAGSGSPGAGPEAQVNRAGCTALHAAAWNGSEQCLAALLERAEFRAAVEAANCIGDTALMVAAREGQRACLLMLLEKGGAAAEFPNGTQDGDTAIIIAAASNQPECLAALLRHVVVSGKSNASGVSSPPAQAAPPPWGAKRREQKPCGVDAGNASGITPLMYASYLGHEACVEVLVAAGADVFAKDDAGQTAIQIAKTDEIRAQLRGAGSAAERKAQWHKAALLDQQARAEAAKRAVSDEQKKAAGQQRGWGGLALFDFDPSVLGGAVQAGMARMSEIRGP